MNPDRWARVKELLDATLELSPDKRSDYLSKTCGNDTSLQSEVKSLLDSYDDSGDFMDSLDDAEPRTDPGQVEGVWTVVADTGHVLRVAAESSEAAKVEAAASDPSFLPVAVFPGRVFEVGHPAALAAIERADQEEGDRG